MKSLILLLALITVTCQAQTAPAYLKDATITVKLKNGQEYIYSANEYAVVKRGSKKIEVDTSVPQVARQAPAQESSPKRHKHIISGELLSSRDGGLKEKSTSSTVEVETERRVGAGIMYQNNIYKDLYLGGRVDTNGGAGVNVGVGF